MPLVLVVLFDPVAVSAVTFYRLRSPFGAPCLKDLAC
jgi:hypothetical protein